MSNSRAFFALWPDLEVRRQIARVGRSLNGCGGRMLQPQDLHLTLCFLGDLDAQRRRCVETVADSFSAAPVVLQIDRIDQFPRARILWVGPLESPPSLITLHDRLSSALQSCGFAPETRAFTPHLTLYRKAQRVEPGRIDPPIRWQAESLTLACAVGGSSGAPSYRILNEWSLRSL
ncbi:RNA 2',3'-cyclic phosphodiesterase [Candidatus Endoriftia persephone]|jgi:2'-5' RNA ligase|uniref:RNA 2',3'-cyclic phosphodiesterase n=2 Tax=Gammaproteobacteria TaxID=1236 RepID=G2FBE4_9GAMM|nr:RNA 2',3'-cyclic phosphodiesterase [Candidatus Endoriftia persephone]EGW56082.1 2'-5' RNA ligase [endosymbiont of Tevnia jerichonana (vent Tica)]USF88200.1 RNA 2',3'-cyclic phosphodiesterase [Candidatus Endoriftia persephone]